MDKKFFLKPGVLFACLAVLFTWIQLRPQPFVVHAGHSRVNLKYDRSFVPSYADREGHASAFEPGSSTPLSLTSSDFDADGSPDLVQGFSTGKSGLIALYRGNSEAYAPKLLETRHSLARGIAPHPYLNQAVIYEIPEPPDFLIAGDFNQDGYPDLLAAARGSQKAYFLAGDGSGAFADPSEIHLPGSLTALVAAQFHSGDVGLDVLAAVNSSNGPALLYYEAARGGLGAAPISLAMPFSASILRTGLLDGDSNLDLAIAGNGQFAILHGAARAWSGSDAEAIQSRLEIVNLPTPAAAIALGDFISDRDHRTEIAVLSADGLTLSFLSRGTGNTSSWQTARRLALASRVDLTNPANVLVAGRFTDDPGEQLLVVDATGKQVSMFAASGTDGIEQVLTVSAENTPFTAIPTRTGAAARAGLSILQRGVVANFINAPTNSVTVSTTADVLDAPDLSSLDALIAHPGADGKISLREAVIASNNSGGGSNIINIPEGTYTLSIAGRDDSALKGDLDVLTGATILGAGSAKTIIQAGASAGSGIDKIFSFNPQGARDGFAVGISGVTLRYGKNLEGNGGAFDFDGGPDFGGRLTMSDVVLDQNSTVAGSGGGAMFYHGGTIAIDNSTISNNVANGGAQVFGGGLAFDAVPSESNGIISITRTTVSGNSGGGLASLTIPMGVHNSSIVGNHNTNAGGGVYGAVALDEATVVTGNTAGSGGGVAGSGTISGVTISGNSADGSGGGILAISGNLLTVNNSRIVGNTATDGKSAADIREGSSIQAINNWWGSNATPEDAVASSGVVFDPWLQMTFAVSPAVIAPGRTATLTASIRTNSHNQSGFSVPRVANNTPVAFAFKGVDGASADPGTAATISGAATSTVNAGTSAGDGTASATIDDQTLTKPIKVNAQATKLVVAAPAVATPQVPFTITVTAVDASNNTDTTYSGVVAFTSSDQAALLPANMALVNGTGTFSVTLQTPGSQTITATDFNTTSITGTASLTVNQNVATHFQVISPNSATAGLPFSLLVTALDSANNIAKNYAGTVKFSSTDAKGVFPATANLVAGLGIFNMTLETAGPQTITVTDLNTPSTNGTSGTTIVHAGPPSQFAIAAPATVITGTPFTFTTTITDAFGNPASGYVGTLHFTSSDPTAVLPADTTLNNGSGTFQATLKAIGIQTITATDTVIPSITGTANIRVLQLPATHFSVVAPASVTAAVPFNFTVQALDVNNQPTSNYTGTVHFTSTDPLATLPANATLTNGVGTFPATLRTGPTQTITATDTVTPSITGTSNNINVIGGPATSIAVTAPATATAGIPFNFTVTAKDQFGNVAPGYSGTLHFTSTDPLAVLPANATLINGVGTFPATLKTIGSQTITATDTVNGSLSGTSNPILVSIGVATHFSVTAPPTAIAGQAFNFTVTALDVANNTVVGYTGTVHFTSTDPAAVLPANATLTNGVGTFPATLKTAGTQTITATDTLTPSITGTSNPIVVSAGTATKFLVSAPATATAGIAFSFSVTAKDAFNNTATAYAGTVHFTSSDAAAVLPPNATLTNGVGTFNATLMTFGSQTLTATDTVNPAITGSATISVGTGATMHLLVSAPSTVTAGTAFSFTVTAKDGSNNTVTTYSGTVHFTSTDPLAVLPADVTLVNGTGTFSATLKTTGTQTITATDTVTATINGTSNPIQVVPGAITTLIVSAPASVTAGASFNFTVTAKDSSGNVVTNYNGTLHFTSTDGAAVLPPNSVLVNGTGTFLATLKTAGTQTITAVDTVSPGINGTSNPILVTPGTAVSFTVTAPATATAGSPFNFTVTAKDANNNVVTGYTGTVHFTSSDAAALLPVDAMLTNGTGSFQATLKTTGTQTITATDTVTPSITGTSNPINVVPGTAMTIVVSAPAAATAGTPFNFTVTAKDGSGNVVTGYNGTLHFSSTDGAAILPADSKLTNGVGTFPATLNTAGTQTITATDTVIAGLSGTSNPILVTAGVAVKFVVVAPGTATANTPFNFTVTAKDAHNNTVMNYAGTVHFTSTDPAAVLPPDSTLTNGVGSFPATLNTSGTQTITATDTVAPSITGTSGPIVVGSGTAMTLLITAPATATAGTPFAFTVTAKDTKGNTVTSYNGTLHFTSTDGAAVLPADVALVNGTGTFSATLKTAGTQTISAADVAAPTITGTSNPILVTAGTAVQFVVQAPSAAIAGTPINFTVTAKDAFNNTVLNYAGTVHFTSTDAAAVLPANATLTNGSGTFSATLKTAGTQTITATDTATPSVNGTSNPIQVSPASATHLSVTAPSTVNAGAPFNFTVTALDAFGNTATGYTGTLHFTSTDPNATLPANATLTNGVGTFQATLKTVGIQTITATDTATPSVTGTSNPITVVTAGPINLVVSAPSPVTAGNPFNFSVTAMDTFGNVVTGYAGTLHFTSTDATATLPANATLTNGVGTFPATLRTRGTQTITAIDTVIPGINGTSNPITVVSGPTMHLVVTAPSSVTAGTPFNFTVTAQDAFGNVMSSYNGTLHFTSTDGAAVLPPNSVLVNGTGTFPATLKTAGTQTITAVDTVSPGINGTSNPILVTPGTAVSFTVTAPATATAGSPFNFTVTAKDANNNVVTGYTGTVHFTSSDAAALLPVDAMLTNGTGSFQATLKTTGTQTITATDTVTPSITGTSNPINVIPGTAMTIVVSAPAAATAGTPFNFTVTAKDGSGNVVTGYNGTLHFSSTDGAAILPADSKLTNGVGTFPATLNTAGTQTITATDTVIAGLSGTSNPILVTAGVAVKFVVVAPGTATANTPFNFTVTAKDAHNNTVMNYAGTVHFTSTDPAAVLPPDSTLTNGVGSFPATLNTSGTQTITATDTVAPSITGTSGPIVVGSGTAMTLLITAPATATAGTPFAFTVTAKDTKGNTVTSYNGTLHFTSTDGAAVLPADVALVNGTGTFSATLKTAGTQTISAADVAAPTITGTSNPILVTAGTAVQFVVQAPSAAIAGTPINFTVTAKDAFNNTVLNYAGTVHFTSTDAAAVLPADGTLTNGSGTFSATLKTAGTQTITATDTANPSVTGTSNPIAVSSATATHFQVTAPGTASAGSPFNFTVTAKDDFNNTVTGYTGTVHFTSTDAAAALPGNATLTNGVGAFQATLKTTGTHTITATDTATASITGTSNPIIVTPGAAMHLVVSAPSTATAGVPFNFTVTVQDQDGNVVTGYSGTLHFTSSDAAAVLPADAKLTNGVGTFPATLKTSGTQTITATDTVATTVTGQSNPIQVSAATATHLSVTAPPTAAPGVAFNFTVTALDQFNNTATGYTGTLHFTSTDSAAVLPAIATLTNGVGTFPATLKTSGTQTITATDTVTPSITGTSNPIQVGMGAATHFSVTAPSTATSGAQFNFTVTALDAFNNTVTGYAGTVHFTSTDAAAILPANATLTNGVGTFPATLKTAGTQTITATDAATPAINGTSNPIQVSPGTATHFSVSAPPTATAGVAFNFTVTALDASNNTATGYAGTVHFTSTDPAAVLPANSTLTNGVGTFPATLKTAGTHTITATDTATASINGTSNPIQVSPASATHLSVVAPATASAGAPFNFTVTALDAFGNTATAYTGTLHFTSTDPNAVLPPNASLTNGVGTFQATLKTVGAQTITATDTATPSITGTSNPIIVVTTGLPHLVVSAPSSVTAGTPFNFTVTAMDAFGNVVTGYNGTVHFTSTDPAASLPPNATLINGVGTFPGTLRTFGTQTITATDTVTPAITGTSSPIMVASGPTMKLVVTAPSSVTAGAPFNFTVTAQDAFGNVMSGYNGTLHFTSTDPAAVLPTDAMLVNGTGTFPATLKTAGTQTITATDTANPTLSGTSNPILVTPATAVLFTVVAPNMVTAGNPFNFTVTAKDPFNNIATGYTGSIHFTSTDPAAVLPGNAMLTNGAGTFTATLKTTGTQTITATDTVASSITGTSNPINVVPGLAMSLVVSAPATATAGAPFNFTVTAKDSNGNVVTNYNGTLHFTSTDTAGVLPADATLVNGVGTFQATLNTAGTQTITATDTAQPGLSGMSNPILVIPGPTVKFAVSAPASAIAGQAFNFTVTAQDAHNNTVTNYPGTVHFTSTDPAAQLPADMKLTNGVGSFPATLKTTGTWTITATDTVAPSITGTSNPIVVGPGAIVSLVVNAPATAIAGTPFNFTVTAKDQSGNVVTSYNGTLHFTSTDSAAVLPPDTAVVNGIGTFQATLKIAGTQTITATDTVTALTGTSSPILVVAGTATHFVVSAPSTAIAGTPFNFTITAKDAFNNTVTNYAGTVHFTSTDAAATLPSDATLTNGLGTFNATFRTGGPQTLTATDTVSPAITGSATIQVSGGTATHFSVTAPSSATAGVAFNFTVTALDANNNTATTYTGTVHFTSTDGAAILPVDGKLTNGVGTFSATLKTSGSQTITATDTVDSSITGTSGPISVGSGPITHFNVVAPSAATSGVAFNFSVTAADQFNNTVTGYTGTVHFTTTDAAGVLPANSVLTNGVGTFSATLKTAGNQTITATDTVTSSITGTSNQIAVAATGATHFSVTAPSTATAGLAFNFTVTALDANNNTATSYTGTVHFTSTDAAAILPGDGKLTNGIGTFSATLKTSGTQTITAMDVVNTSITGTSGPIAVSAGTATHFSVVAPGSVTAGAVFNFTVTALDQFNNTATGYSGTVQFTSTDAAATLPGNSGLSNGIGTFPATLKTVGVQTITATDTSNASVTGTSNPITVGAGTVTHFSVTAPGSVTGSVPFSFTLAALDAFNNPVPTYSGTVRFTSTDPLAILPGNSIVTNGTGTFQATLRTPGIQTITATDVATPSIAGTSNPINVTLLAATHFSITGPSAATAGVGFSVTVTALDSNNNPVLNYGGTVHFSSSDAQATLPPNSTLANGTGTFPVILRTTGVQTVTAADTANPALTASLSVTVSAGPATHFAVAAPATANSGTSFNATVTALDQANNVAIGYTGRAHFTSTDPSAVLPADTALINGVATVPATLITGGNQTITATDTINPGISGTSNNIAVAVAIVVQTSPAGRTFSVDGVTYTSAQTFFFQPGTTHTLLVPQTTQPGTSGTQYVFKGWNNGATTSAQPTLQFTTGTAGATYTANFTTQYLLTTSVSPDGSGTILPPTGFFDAGTTVNLVATAAPGFVFVNWSGPVTTTGVNTATVVLNAPTSVVAFFNVAGPPQIPEVTANPSALFVTYFRGTTPITTTRSVMLTSTHGDTLYSVTSSFPWITVTPTPGFTPATLTVNFDFTGLTAGVYPGALTVLTPYQSLPIPVTVTVVDFPSLVATPPSLNIPIATPTSVAQSLDVLLTANNRELPFSLSTTASWLTVSSVNAQNMMTPARLHITASPNGMPNGIYTASVVVSAPSATNTPLQIPVTMVIGTQTQSIQVAGFVNGASFQTGSAAPNTIFSVFGSNLTCDTGSLVLVDGLPAEVLAATTSQINFVVPGNDSNLNLAHIQVACGVNVSPIQTISMAETSPAIFSATSSGTGQASIVNQNASQNGATSPASRGTIVSVFGTGFGKLAAPDADGLKRVVAPVTAAIGGIPADVVYAGAAPGYSTGLQQINVRVPDNAPAGASVPIVLKAGQAATQPGATMAVN